ncbi:MAG: magnesium and cobalt transport protein CorA [Deltaproteobacteria bacterium RIFOXYA12_FULL_61_11]|nr:MAG: magnesium and cobalt transport protein CorA [Deltaproteobacteria bacterium RIFOXYA12_FULL_61_11]
MAGPPGTISPPQDAHPPRLQVLAYDATCVTERDLDSVAALQAFRTGSQLLWVNIEGVGDAATFKALGDLFGLHSLALEDVVNLHQRPKAEEYGDYAYVVLQMPTNEESLSLEQLSLFFGKDFVITIQEGLPGDCLEPVRHRIRNAPIGGRLRTSGADYLAYAVMDAIIDSYFPVTERLDARLEHLEEQVVAPAAEGTVAELHAVRHDLQMLRRILAASREAISKLERGETGPVSEATLPFFRDCHDHTAQLLDAVETLRELSAGLLDLHLAGVSNRMNEAMKMLTLIATIFIPLSFIASLYGMNFDRSASPWNMPELEWYLGYPFALTLMLLTVLGFLWYFRHRGWLGGPGRAGGSGPHRDKLPR